MIAQITDITPEDYRPPPWSILNADAAIHEHAVLNVGDVVLVLDGEGHEALGDLIIEIIHPASGSRGWVERALVEF